MNRDYLSDIATPLWLLPALSYTADTNGTAVDLLPYDGKAMIVLDAAAGTSDTLTTNGVFSADTDWTKGTGWTIGSGKADCDGTQTDVSDLSQNQTVTEGVNYTVTYTVSSRTAGSVKVILAGTAGTTRSANGTYTEVIIAGDGSDPKLVFQADADFVGKIDDVSVKAISMAVKLQESADNSTFVDITGGAFTTVYGIASVQKKTLHIDERKRYLRAVADITGASGSMVLSCVALAYPTAP